jgi:hypothetical protein
MLLGAIAACSGVPQTLDLGCQSNLECAAGLACVSGQCRPIKIDGSVPLADTGGGAGGAQMGGAGEPGTGGTSTDASRAEDPDAPSMPDALDDPADARGPDDTLADVGRLDAGSADAEGAGPCFEPLACSPRAADAGPACDPVCQQGCGCRQRCSLLYGETVPTCRSVGPAPIALGQDCNARSDQCVRGSVCLGEQRMECGAHCYRYCRTNADCETGSLCIGGIEWDGKKSDQSICTPAEACDPTGGDCVRADRQSGAFACYRLSPDLPDETMCECAGTKAENDLCMGQHDCQRGFECVRLVDEADGRCRKLCKLADRECRGGLACYGFTSPGGVMSKLYGFCV